MTEKYQPPPDIRRRVLDYKGAIDPVYPERSPFGQTQIFLETAIKLAVMEGWDKRVSSPFNPKLEHEVARTLGVPISAVKHRVFNMLNKNRLRFSNGQLRLP